MVPAFLSVKIDKYILKIEKKYWTSITARLLIFYFIWTCCSDVSNRRLSTPVLARVVLRCYLQHWQEAWAGYDSASYSKTAQSYCRLQWRNPSSTRFSFLTVTAYNTTLRKEKNKKLSYRKHIARQLSTQYVEGIYGNSVTLKSR